MEWVLTTPLGSGCDTPVPNQQVNPWEEFTKQPRPKVSSIGDFWTWDGVEVASWEVHAAYQMHKWRPVWHPTMNFHKFMEVVRVDQAILAFAHMERIIARIESSSPGPIFFEADEEYVGTLRMREIFIDLETEGFWTREVMWATARAALESLLLHYQNHRPSPKMVKEGRPVGQWTPPEMPLAPEIPDDTEYLEIDPLAFYQPPQLVSARRSEWHWLGESWVAEDLWWEYSRACYRITNQELYNRQAFEYILTTEENLLQTLAQSARESLEARLSISMHFRADHTKSEWDTVDRLLTEMFSESS